MMSRVVDAPMAMGGSASLGRGCASRAVHCPDPLRRNMRAALFQSSVIALVILEMAEPALCGWQNFTSAGGLADDYVSCVLEDRAGNLWFGTNGGGVSRYNGATWRTFSTADGLADNDVTSILEDRAGNLWFGTLGGVSRYDGSTWRTFGSADGLASNNVSSILEDRAGNLWFGTFYGGGVSRYDGFTWRTFGTADGLASNDVRSLLEDRAGNLWFATGASVSRYDGSTWQTFTITDGRSSVTSILEDRAGNLWFGALGFDGLNGYTAIGDVTRYDGSTWRTFTTADGLAHDGVSSIGEDRAGNLWFGTYGGISRYNGSTWRTFTTTDGLATNCVNAILEDRAGNLWFGTCGRGASRYDGSAWRTFTTADGLAGNLVTSFLEDQTGSLWFGTGRGVSRYSGSTWRTFTTADGLANNIVTCLLEDQAGNLWLGTDSGGASRYDGVTWRTFTTADGLASNSVYSILEDRAGNLWFGTHFGGISRYDGSTWRTFSTADGLASNLVTSILEDRAGNLWFGTLYGGGVSRYDGSTWRTFSTADGLASNDVRSLLEDRTGNLWFGTNGSGVSRYDGFSWRTFTTTDGLANNVVTSLLEDRAGNLWFGTYGGVSRYDGSTWRTFTTTDGLADNLVRSLLEDRAGNLWFGTEIGASRYEPDRVPPRIVFLSSPPRVASTRNQNAVFVAAFGEAGIEFSYRFDGSAWSNWSSISSWFGNDLVDGMHVLEVHSRDFLSNMDSSAVTFEVDATPPAPVIASPAYGQAVRGIVGIRGSATDARFERYRVAFRRAGASSWDALTESTMPVTDGPLATWDTSPLPDGSYEIRLVVEDTLGLSATDLVAVRVDNQPPFDDQTAPARVFAATGGDVYTTNGELHLYFPPNAFGADAQVTIDPVPADSVPATLSSGAVRVLAGYEVGWSGAALEKHTRLEFSLAGLDQGTLPGALAIHFSSDGTSWQRLGGTVEGGRITLAITADGLFALYAGGTVPSSGETLSALSFTPRVFSPSGTFADRQVGIGFSLGRSAAVTVRVYNRGGRLVQEVVSGVAMGPGSNIVRWDGRDRAGVYVADGIYLVTVEALGETRRNTLAVVR